MYAFSTHSVRVQYAFSTHSVRIQYAFTSRGERDKGDGFPVPGDGKRGGKMENWNGGKVGFDTVGEDFW